MAWGDDRDTRSAEIGMDCQRNEAYNKTSEIHNDSYY